LAAGHSFHIGDAVLSINKTEIILKVALIINNCILIYNPKLHTLLYSVQRVPFFFQIVATSAAGICYPSGAPSLPPVYSGVRVTRSLVLCVMFCELLFVLFSFSHCVVCPS
jgi:hypothetical protein